MYCGILYRAMTTHKKNTYQSEIKLVNKLGFHLRAAAAFVKLANKYNAEITVEHNRQKANGKSIIGLLSLAVSIGVKLKITAKGNDGGKAIAALTKLISNKFGEKE